MELLNDKINLCSLRVLPDSMISATICHSRPTRKFRRRINSVSEAMAKVNEATIRKFRGHDDLSKVTVKAHELLELSFESTATFYDDSFNSATISHEVYGDYLCGGDNHCSDRLRL